MAASGVTFIRKDGRIIPIRAPSGNGPVAHASRTLQLAHAAGKLHQASKAHVAARGGSSKVQVNKNYDALALGLSVASGVVGATTFASGAKGMFAGFVGGHALDAAGIAANVASVAGKGKTKERTKQAAKQEARNFVIGNAVFAAGLVGLKRNRVALKTYAETSARYAAKIASLGRKVLGG